MKRISGYSDGACKLNPGRGGWGSVMVIEFDDRPDMQYVSYGGKYKTTNQEMELTGFLNAIKMIPKTESKITPIVFADSTYVLKGFTISGKDGDVKYINGKCSFTGWVSNWMKNGWKKKNGDSVKHSELWKNIADELNDRVQYYGTIKLKWVKGHSGNRGNELADLLANEGVPKP